MVDWLVFWVCILTAGGLAIVAWLAAIYQILQLVEQF